MLLFCLTIYKNGKQRDGKKGKMMRILVVDDEPMMRDVYQELIDWQEYGFTLVGAADDGKTALEMLQNTSVDIVITDLKMPIMSGLELIKKASEQFPQVKFIVMSGYDDFHLVREAYQLGVKEYFLKMEMDADVLLQSIFKIQKEIEAENEKIAQEINNVELFKKMYQNNFYSNLTSKEQWNNREGIIKNIIWGADGKEAAKQLSQTGRVVCEDNMYIMSLTLLDYYKIEESIWNGEREMLKYAILNVLEETCDNYDAMYPFCNLPNQFVILCAGINHSASVCKKVFEQIQNAFLLCFGMKVDCGVSGPVSSFGELKRIHQEAKMASSYSFITGHDQLVIFHDVLFEGEELNITKKIGEIKRLLSKAEPDRLREEAHTLRVSPKIKNYEQIEPIKKLFYLYYIEMMSFLEEKEMKGEFTEHIIRYNEIKDEADLQAFNSWLLKSVNEVADILMSNSDISKAEQYIKNNYGKQLSLNEVAEYLEMSPWHFSKVFYKKVGIHFSQYLMQVRMEEAVQLLKNTNLKIYEVAMRVGYNNTDQFSRMFKKTIGKSPKEFKKQF